MKNEGRTEEKSTFGPAMLAIIGGVLMILGGSSVPLMYSSYQSLFQDGPFMASGIMSGGGWRMVMPTDNGLLVLSTMAFVSLAAGLASVAGGYMIYKEPEKARSFGIVVLAASAVGLFGMSGFGIGAILGIIAGVYVLAITKN